ncbi:MAG: hypothetical protein V3U87_04140 [Methylococcaceae bacterium]
MKDNKRNEKVKTTPDKVVKSISLLDALHASFKKRSDLLYEEYSNISIKQGVDSDAAKQLLLRTNFMNDIAASLEGAISNI